MTTNAALKALLLNARLIYLVKKQEVNAPAGALAADCQALDQKYQTLFGHLANPQLWKNPISFAAGATSRLILALNQVDPTDTNAFLENAQALYNHLTDSLLQAPLAALSTVSTFIWNIKMLNALRLTLQTVDERKAFFKGQGTDLDQHEEFPQMESQQLQLIATYRELLKSDAIEATESKVRNIETRKDDLASENQLDEFLRRYENLSKFIGKQVAKVSEMPILADRPSAENWQALETLSRTLVLLGEQIAKMAVAGNDFTQQRSFAALSSEQQILQEKYQKALLSNEIESTSTQVGELQQFATTIPRITDLPTLEAKYKAINQWLTTAVAALT